jgi:hypothetical protein
LSLTDSKGTPVGSLQYGVGYAGSGSVAVTAAPGQIDLGLSLCVTTTASATITFLGIAVTATSKSKVSDSLAFSTQTPALALDLAGNAAVCSTIAASCTVAGEVQSRSAQSLVRTGAIEADLGNARYQLIGAAQLSVDSQHLVELSDLAQSGLRALEVANQAGGSAANALNTAATYAPSQQTNLIVQH